MNTVVLVTGASGDIGSAICRRFGQAGFSVAIHYHQNEKNAKALENELIALGARAHCFQADLSDESAIRRMMSLVEYHLGPVDILINNAGFAQQKLLTQTEAADLDQMLSVHLKGAYLLSKAAAPHMIEQGRGVMIQIASMWGQVGASMESAYSAAKGALITLTKALAKELGPSGIRVNAISPGLIDTKMNQNIDKAALEQMVSTIPLGRMGTSEDIARCAFFLASDDAGYITGQNIAVNGGLIV